MCFRGWADEHFVTGWAYLHHVDAASGQRLDTFRLHLSEQGTLWVDDLDFALVGEDGAAFREALELGGNVCFYMFAGGTNFGFMGGANIGKSYSPRPDTPSRYIPHTTSYDVDALIGENGEPTEKYYLCRDVLDEHLKRARRPRSHQKQKTQAISVPLSQTADLFDKD